MMDCNELSQLDGISSEILKFSKSKKLHFMLVWEFKKQH